MVKKSILLLSSLFLLAACGEEDSTALEEPVAETEAETEIETETEPEEAEVETEDVAAEETANDSVKPNHVGHTYEGLVDETTFTEEYGLQAWNDYQAVMQDAKLGDITVLNQENPNFEEINGTPRSEIEERFKEIGLREDVFQEEAEVSEMEELVLYRYPPAEDSGYTDVAQFLAELTFYYFEDQLMFSAITPGFYSIDLNNVPNAEDLMLFLTVDEIKELNPQIFTIAEMQIGGETIQQVMTPAMGTDGEGNEALAAFYFFTKGEDILKYAFLPFEVVSQDFPTGSILVFQEMIPELEGL